MKNLNGDKIEIKTFFYFNPIMSSLTRVLYDDLVLGRDYFIKKNNILYKGVYFMHYKKYIDNKEPLIFIEVTPNPENKKYVEFMMSDEFYI